MKSLPKFRTLSSNEEIRKRLLSEFSRDAECVNIHDLSHLNNAACGCSSSACIEKRYKRTESRENFDVVKIVNGKITVVINDVVIKVEENKVEEKIVTIETEKKPFLI